jgi:glutamine cyclotransferase
MNRFFWLLMASCLFFMSCNNSDQDASTGTPAASVPVMSFNIGAAYPHDTSYFTEGLEFYQGDLLESTGMKGQSKLVRLSFPDGKLVREVKLDEQYFGEGLTVLRDTVYQLTWQERKVLLYAAKDFRKIGELPLRTDGWGLTNNGKELIASDGSSNLYFYEPGTFRLLRVQSVTENDVPVVNINELEYINGFVYANQWQYNYILKIDPNNGQVVGKMDLTPIVNNVKTKDPHADFLNGIAYNPETKKVYVTGKYWPALYELQFQF